MMNYGEAIDWMVRHDTAFRFVRRTVRQSFVTVNESIPGDKALELAVTVSGKNYMVHAALDSSKEPSNAIAVALISCVEFMAKKFAQGSTAYPANSELRKKLYGSVN